MKHIKIFETFREYKSLANRLRKELIEKNLVKEKDIHVDGDDEITIYDINVDPEFESNNIGEDFFGTGFKWFFNNHAVLHIREENDKFEIEFEFIEHDDEDITDVVDYIGNVWGKYFEILI